MSVKATIKSVYGRVDRLQRRNGVRIALAVLVLLACGIGWGSIITTTKSLDNHRRNVVRALSGQGTEDPKELAQSLLDRGEALIDGELYRNDLLKGRPELIVNQSNTAIADPDVLATALVYERYPAGMPLWLIEQPGTTWMLALVTTAWLLLVVWMGLTVQALITSVATAVAVGLAALAGSDGAMWALGGMGMLTFTFVMLIRLALITLSAPKQVLAVAHTVVKEASRTKIALVFIVAILILLPLLPLGLDASMALRYQIQTFIARSMGFTFYLAACMTLFLSCATVAFEIRDRQIWQLMTKPVSRMSYLLGKWLGVMTVNLIIMVIAGVSIFTYIQYLSDRPVASGMEGFNDRQQVNDAVLTARVGSPPDYDELTPAQINARIDQAIERDPTIAGADVPVTLRNEMREQLGEAYQIGQRTIPPFGGGREYLFSGLSSAKRHDSTLTLRYRFHIMRDDEHETFPAVFILNRDQSTAFERTYVPTMTHVFTIPPDFVREDDPGTPENEEGTLVVTVVNMYAPSGAMRGAGALNFEEKDFELLYKVGSFEGNFVRAVMLDWVKLAFLAVLGICCATFLSFPVACLTSFTIFIAGTIGPFLAESLEQYYPPSLQAVDWSNAGMVIKWAFMSSIKGIAQAIVFLLEAFGSYRPTQSLVEGRVIPWGTVGLGTLKVGVLWSGLVLALGIVVMRQRQLAIYSGHG